jgi:bifunctional DNase/RNase
MVEIEINGVYHKPYPQIVLKQKDGDGHLHIPIGLFEAWAIALAHSDKSPSRPISYDLLCNLLNEVSAQIGKVEITDMREGIFYAKIYIVDQSSKVTTLDSRPSDAIALALRAGAPVFVAPLLLGDAATQDAIQNATQGALQDISQGGGSKVNQPMAQDQIPEKIQAMDGWEETAKNEGSKAAVEPPELSDQLHKLLARAVAEEAYEEAARLRDEIARLEQL